MPDLVGAPQAYSPKVEKGEEHKGVREGNETASLLCVVHFVLVRLAVFDQLKVDALWLNGIDQLQNWNAGANGGVLAKKNQH